MQGSIYYLSFELERWLSCDHITVLNNIHTDIQSSSTRSTAAASMAPGSIPGGRERRRDVVSGGSSARSSSTPSRAREKQTKGTASENCNTISVISKAGEED